MPTVASLIPLLSTPNTQLPALHALLSLSAAGADITPATPSIARHILPASSPSPLALSLAYDAIISSPSTPHWLDALSSLAKHLSPTTPSTPSLTLLALKKLPSLPHPALAHILLVSPHLPRHLSSPASPPPARRAAVAALAAIALRPRPLTAPQAEPIRLDALSADQVLRVRHGVETSLAALVAALDDADDAVASAALHALTHFAAASDAVEKSAVLRKTTEATAAVVWDLLLARVRPIEDRFRRRGERRLVLRGVGSIAAHALGGASLRKGGGEVGEANEVARSAVGWAAKWIDTVLGPACDDGDWTVGACAASVMVYVCCFCKADVGERKVRWACKGVARLVRILAESGEGMSSLVRADVVKDAFRGLAAVSKEAGASGKFVVTSAVGLLPHVAGLPQAGERLEGMVVLGSAVVEFDLSGRDGGGGASLATVLKSGAWKAIVRESERREGRERRERGGGEAVRLPEEDDATAAELVCCFGQALLDASAKIVAVTNFGLREGLLTLWAAMLANFLARTVGCLTWRYSSASSFAREMYLKLFEALGQYSAYATRSRGTGMDEYERLQEVLIAAAMKQDDVDTRAALLLCVTKYWIASPMKAEANAGHVIKAIWRHAQEHYRDDHILLEEARRGALWSEAEVGGLTRGQRATEGGYVSLLAALTKKTRSVIDTVGTTFTEVLETKLFGSIALATSAAEGSTLTTDYAYSSLGSLVALVHRNPTHAEKAIAVARRYLDIMERAESSDLLVKEAVENAIAGMEMYLDEFFPKPVAVRPQVVAPIPLQLTSPKLTGGTFMDPNDPHAWLASVTQSCVFATSRLDDPSKESVTVSTEEAVLHASSVAALRLRSLNPSTLRNREPGSENLVEGDSQTLSGATDPFSVVASHAMDTVKALATLQVTVVNRSVFQVSNVSLTFSAGGALTPLPDAATSLIIGSLAPGSSATQRVTLAVRHNQGFAARVQLSVNVREDETGDEAAGSVHAEQPCLPYYIPSSDVLLLRAPPPSAGVDVFRRRWDLMREASSFHVIIRQNQDLDGFVDTLERHSGCLREVGRIRITSHVSAMVADSSRGDYIALAALAPEARGETGSGPCLAYVTIRSNSAAYSRAFRSECREWLKSRFKVVIVDEDPEQAKKVQALHPQDAYFSNDSRGLTDYQRWRAAHAARMACS